MEQESEITNIIPWRGKWRHKVNLDKAPVDTRQLDGFLFANGLPKCFVKAQGGWYKIQDSQLLFVNRVLYTMSFKDWHAVASNKNFIANVKL